MGFPKPVSLGGVCLLPEVQVQTHSTSADHVFVCFCMIVWESRCRLSTHSRLVDSVPSTYAKTAYKRLSFAQRIFVSELVSLCFHVLLCRDWTLFFVWNMRLHDAPRDVGFPPLLVYVLAFPSAVWRSGFGRPCLDASSQRFIQSSHSL